MLVHRSLIFKLLVILTLDNIINHDIKLVIFKTVALLFGR